MTPLETTHRNQCNAQNSTGPKTPVGKAVSSANAQKHGATSQPNLRSVAAWLAIILDRSDLGPGDFTPVDEHAISALTLAGAEAQLVKCQRALQEFEAGVAAPTEWSIEITKLMDMILEEIEMGDRTRKEVRSGMVIFHRLARSGAEKTQTGGKRQLLLRHTCVRRKPCALKPYDAGLKSRKYAARKGQITETNPSFYLSI